MNLEHASAENSKYRREYYPLELNKSTDFTQKDTRSSAAHRVPTPEIAYVLRKLSDNGLCGQAHVKQYLHDLYRRNCRPNTIRTNGYAIILFLGFLKTTGRKHLETITRNDLSAFIEHEQDRGL